MRIYLIFILLTLQLISFGQKWTAVGDGCMNTDSASANFNYPSLTGLTVYNNNLYVAGYFDSIKNFDVRNGLAFWNSTTWSNTYIGNKCTANLLCVYKDSLITAGSFGTVPGNPGNNYCLLESKGGAWKGIGGTFSSMPQINAILAYDSVLYVAGNFTSIGGVAITYFAQWDGTKWSSVGGPFNGTIYSMTIYNKALYVTGYFTSIGGVTANNVAIWDGYTWAALGNGVSVYPRSIVESNGKIYVAGQIDSAGAVAVNNIAQWDGNSWTALGSGVNGPVASMTSYNNNLYVGGCFDSAGPLKVYYIAGWNGSTWFALDSGVISGAAACPVANSITYNNSLIVAGAFILAGNIPVNNIASWTSPLGINELAYNYFISVYPNPSNHETKNTIEVYNGLGEKVYQSLIDNTPFTLPLNHQASGIYLYRIVSENSNLVASGKLIIQ